MVVRTWLRASQAAISFNVHHNLARFLIARFEAPLIASALYFVQVNLLGKMELERFLLSWLGVVILMWTFKSILRADEARVIYGVIKGVIKYPAFEAIQSRTGSLFVEFLVDLLIIGSALIISRGFSGLSIMVVSAVFLILTQAATHFAILTFHLHMSRWLNVKNVLLLGFVVFAIMSPVIFMFHDLGQFGRAYFTSVNPAAHFLAAYYNVFWFREPISLQVLPVFLLCSTSFVLIFSFFYVPQTNATMTNLRSSKNMQKVMFLGRFAEKGGITGMELFHNFYAFGPHPIFALADRAEKLMAMRELQDLLQRGQSTYSRLNDQYLEMLLLACLAGPEDTVISLSYDATYRAPSSHVGDVLQQINMIMGTKLSIDTHSS